MRRAQALAASPLRGLGEVFLESAAAHPSRLALQVEGEQVTYERLAALAGRIASGLGAADSSGLPLGAVLGARSEALYAGILGTLLSGRGYVPLGLTFPAARNAHILAVSGAKSLVADDRALELLPPLLTSAPAPLTVILPASTIPRGLQAAFPRHRFLGAKPLARLRPLTQAPQVTEGSPAYLLFTSGTTGTPKGVLVNQANASHFLSAMGTQYDLKPDDRCSQNTPITFDASFLEMFLCWGRGASLFPLPEGDALAADDFIRRNRLTVWIGTPALAAALNQLARLGPNVFPSLRYTIFGGERLSASLAQSWQAAAPRALIDNQYGPTEATVACTVYRWDPRRSAKEFVEGTVPLGRPLPGFTIAVVDSALAHCPPGQRGQLCLQGPQVTAGYWQDPGRTAEKFVAMPWDSGPQNRWYLTGDLVYLDGAGHLIHCGREDQQVKIAGHRIELAEVEQAVRKAAQSDLVAVVPFPATELGATGLTAVVAGSPVGEAAILQEAATVLPPYMVPRKVVHVARLPLDANGKLNRRQLLEHLSGQFGEPSPQAPQEGDLTLERVLGALRKVVGFALPDVTAETPLQGALHSLAQAELFAALERACGVTFDLAKLSAKDFANARHLTAALQRTARPRETSKDSRSNPRSFPRWLRANLVGYCSGQRRLNAQFCVRLDFDGPLDVPALRQALQRLVQRHEALHSVVTLLGKPLVTRAPGELSVRPIDLSGKSRRSAEAAAIRYRADEMVRQFDLTSEWPIRVVILKHRKKRHEVLITFCHFLVDGGSAELAVAQLLDTYEALTAGRSQEPAAPTVLDPFPLINRLDDELSTAPGKIPGLVELAALRTGNRAASASSRGRRNQAIELKADTVRELRKLAESCRVSLPTIMAGAFMLSLWSGRAGTLVLQAVWSGRTREMAGMMGPLWKPVFLQAAFATGRSAGELFQDVSLAFATSTRTLYSDSAWFSAAFRQTKRYLPVTFNYGGDPEAEPIRKIRETSISRTPLVPSDRALAGSVFSPTLYVERSPQGGRLRITHPSAISAPSAKQVLRRYAHVLKCLRVERSALTLAELLEGAPPAPGAQPLLLELL